MSGFLSERLQMIIKKDCGKAIPEVLISTQKGTAGSGRNANPAGHSIRMGGDETTFLRMQNKTHSPGRRTAAALYGMRLQPCSVRLSEYISAGSNNHRFSSSLYQIKADVFLFLHKG